MKTAVIRISGMVKLKGTIADTLYRMRLRRKYSCVVFDNPSKEQLGMINKVKDFIAFGQISEETYKKLVEARGKKDTKGELKPFFRLHPPRGGIESKKHFKDGKGVLGNNKEKINELILRML